MSVLITSQEYDAFKLIPGDHQLLFLFPKNWLTILFEVVNVERLVVRADSREDMRSCKCNSNAIVLVCETQGKTFICIGESVTKDV